MTALQLACMNGCYEIVKYLLENGANVVVYDKVNTSSVRHTHCAYVKPTYIHTYTRAALHAHAHARK